MEIVRKIAVFLMLIGFVSAGLYFADYELRIISFLSDYQPAAGLGIGGLGLVALLVTIAMAKKPAEQPQTAQPQA
ncbi:hypothetical protein SAMN05192558_11752 [Actinokineospora alba]|uniref:Uncharacterized protein n=1 Tax=Actinokineospora alba TaxID=504798 RepID=A0A1H0W3S9_9PSEU|nr:hypothetical protein [Actinokineospora alba]TDP67806.1 hypothetical protein C8E96_3360 [Actinokineospora alba]SDI72198.1 hypothetical protein SAMN05421871_10752 [Actinokineospora alba]SDP84956.1 hypothetical protein SAMN05192558_11752 [Actinokineospora alba]